jgi:hypothetical protein
MKAGQISYEVYVEVPPVRVKTSKIPALFSRNIYDTVLPLSH